MQGYIIPCQYFLLILQIDKEKYLLLGFDWHYRAMTGSGIFDHYNPNMIDISEISSDYLLSVQSTSSETYSLPVQEIIRNISELELKQKSNCQVKSVFRSSSSKVSNQYYAYTTLKLIPYS